MNDQHRMQQRHCFRRNGHCTAGLRNSPCCNRGASVSWCAVRDLVAMLMVFCELGRLSEIMPGVGGTMMTMHVDHEARCATQ